MYKLQHEILPNCEETWCKTLALIQWIAVGKKIPELSVNQIFHYVTATLVVLGTEPWNLQLQLIFLSVFIWIHSVEYCVCSTGAGWVSVFPSVESTTQPSAACNDTLGCIRPQLYDWLSPAAGSDYICEKHWADSQETQQKRNIIFNHLCCLYSPQTCLLPLTAAHALRGWRICFRFSSVPVQFQRRSRVLWCCTPHLKSLHTTDGTGCNLSWGACSFLCETGNKGGTWD